MGKIIKTGDRYDLDSAYSDGFEASSAGFINDNPYNLSTERELYDEYETGFADGTRKDE